jgi:hypothetical protein
VNLVWQWCRWFASNVKAQYSLLMSFSCLKKNFSLKRNDRWSVDV